MSRMAGLSLFLVRALPVHDATINFRLYGRRLLDAVTIEVPTTWRDRTAGQSRFRLMKWLPHYLHWYGFAVRTRLLSRSGRPARPIPTPLPTRRP